jgi:hypothetical protein
VASIRAENDAGRSTFNIRTVRAAFSHAYAVLASGLVDPRNLVGYVAVFSLADWQLSPMMPLPVSRFVVLEGR